VSLRLKSLRPALISRPAGRPIVLPAALPMVPRVSALGSRAPATFSADRLVVLLSPIILPMPRLRSVRTDDWLLFTLGEVAVPDLDEIEGLVELTAGCLAPVGAEELRVPIELPIRERWLVVGSFFAFEAGGVLRLLELPMREAPLERAAGCSALLGTDGLVVSILLPILELMLGLILLLVLIRLFVLVAGLFVIVVCEGLLDGVLVLIELPIRDDMLELILLLEFVLSEVEGLLDGVLVLIELPIRDDMLGLIRLLVLGAVGWELIDRLEVLVLGARLVIAPLEMLVLGVRLVIALLDMLLLGALLVIARLEMLLLGARLVIALLEMLLLGARLVMDLLEVLLLGVRLAVTLLELLLGVRLVMDLLEVLLLGVRLAVTLLELLEGVGLDVAFGAGAGFEACRV